MHFQEYASEAELRAYASEPAVGAQSLPAWAWATVPNKKHLTVPYEKLA
jgi:hypothetical protein